jgi:hypothetical protein
MHFYVLLACSPVLPAGCGALAGALLTPVLLLLQNVLWQLDDYLQSSKKAPADTSFRVEVGPVESHAVCNGSEVQKLEAGAALCFLRAALSSSCPGLIQLHLLQDQSESEDEESGSDSAD